MSASPQKLGPYRPPYITCSSCGREHHYDAATGEYQGKCYDCSSFLRRPTEAEHEQMSNFLVWNFRHSETAENTDESDGGQA